MHMYFVASMKQDFANPVSATIASEFVGTSISSQGRSQAAMQRTLPDNPHILHAESRYRGYTRAELTPARMSVDLRAMDNVKDRDAACRTLASFVVEDGRPGPQKA